MGDGGVTKIITGVVDALEKSGRKMTNGISTRLHELGQATKKAAQHFEKTEGEIADKIPVYKVDHNGNVSKLVDGKLEPAHDEEGNLAKWLTEDRDKTKGTGIDSIVDKDGKTTTWSSGDYKLGEKDLAHTEDEGHRVRLTSNSTRIDSGDTELSRATARARIADNEHGLVNYAGFHYEDGEKKFILVGTSKYLGAHSEQYAGIPFLVNKKSHLITGVYSERTPCTPRQRNCDAWLGRYFKNPGLTVNHTFDYHTYGRDLTNKMMGSYIGGLFP